LQIKSKVNSSIVKLLKLNFENPTILIFVRFGDFAVLMDRFELGQYSF